MNNVPADIESLDDHGGGLRAFAGFALIAIVVFGLAWPLATAAIGAALFPTAAHGSLIERNGVVVGSSLVAQGFTDLRYVMPRPSAAGYAGTALAGSNWAPSNPALRERIAVDSATIAAREGIAPGAIPPELLTASGSGIDPHLSPAAVAIQLPRIARARGIDAGALQELLARHTEAPQFGLLGQTRVNVLEFNLALDAMTAPTTTR